MRPEDWRQGMENEAASVEDEGWARETRRYLHLPTVPRQVMALVVVCLSVLAFPANLAMSYGRLLHPWPTLLGLGFAWTSLYLARHSATNPLGRAGLCVMGAVGLAFAITVAIPLKGTTAFLWLLGFPIGAVLACLGVKPPYRAPIGLLTLPLAAWLLINYVNVLEIRNRDALTDLALLLQQAGWLWLGLLLLGNPRRKMTP